MNFSRQLLGVPLLYLKLRKRNYMFAYRKWYNTQHGHICWVEEWRNELDNNLFVAAVLLGLSRAFDCIPYNLIMAKMTAYRMQNENLLCYSLALLIEGNV